MAPKQTCGEQRDLEPWTAPDRHVGTGVGGRYGRGRQSRRGQHGRGHRRQPDGNAAMVPVRGHGLQ
ncbi:hypothetical protein GLA29479_1241 [Lysobacter antibioticus]|nr:hypothetical protein GLA29479_1241 [Lysobacter antibioticus]